MMEEDSNVPANENIQYEERLVCFIDLLGFKSAIDESKSNASVLNALNDALSELEGGRLVKLLHQNVPALTSNGEFTTSERAGATDLTQQHWPIVVTQFSDSFVLSCPADNSGSCLMLLQAVDKLQKIFFWHLGMLMRGGMSKGKLIHIQGGPLFGPAMNAAYALESKSAIYPRVLIDASAAAQLNAAWGSGSTLIFETFDGHKALDLVSCLWFKHRQEPQDFSKFSAQLARVEEDIAKKYPTALPKVLYLKDRLCQKVML